MKLEDQSYKRRQEIDREIALFENEIIQKNSQYKPMNFNLKKMVRLSLGSIV
jgi:hypothetical protein